jgi:hypothetical protein
MSLINDALKRAKQAQQKKNPPGAPPPLRPFKPARKKCDLFLPVLILLLIVTAFFFIGLAIATHKVKNIVAASETATNQAVEIVAAPKTPAQVIGPAAIAAQAPKPTTIQGIAYDPVRPWAIVSGKTVYVGDVVDGMRVLAITRDAVTLAGNGQTNTFVVGQ